MESTVNSSPPPSKRLRILCAVLHRPCTYHRFVHTSPSSLLQSVTLFVNGGFRWRRSKGKKEKEKERKKKGERSPIARTKLFCRFWPFRRECRVDSCANRVQPIHRGEWHCKGQSVARNVFATTTIKWTTWFCSRNWNYRIYVGDIYEAEPLAHHRVSKPGRLISSRVHGAPPATGNQIVAIRNDFSITRLFAFFADNSSSRILERCWGGRKDLNFEGCYRRGGEGSGFVEVEEREECKRLSFMNGQSYREWED